MTKSHVSLEQKQCPICLKLTDVGVLFHNQLRPVLEEKTVTGHELCDDCSGKIEEGYIALIGVEDPGKEFQSAKITGPKRTGDLIWMREAAFKDIFNAPVPERRIGFVTPDAVEKINPKNRVNCFN